MDKGYYNSYIISSRYNSSVAIHNKNGQGLLLYVQDIMENKNIVSQSTIKMDKGYYATIAHSPQLSLRVAIHNKNGQGLLRSLALL